MFNTSTIALAIADILDELEEQPDDEIEGSLRAAQDAVYHGAWGLPRECAEPLMCGLGRTVESIA